MGRWMCVAAVCLASAAAWAETLEEVEKSIIEKNAALKGFEARTLMKQDLSLGGTKQQSESELFHQMMKKGDTWLYRAEGHTKTRMSSEGQEQVSDVKQLLVFDGEYFYMLNETDGQKSAMKMRAPDQTLLVNREFLENLRKDNEVKLLPDEKVDGRAAWVIEAAAKKKEAGAPQTMTYYFDKESGTNLRMLAKDGEGKTVISLDTKDLKVNPSLSEDRFVFKAPEGVQVVDMTQLGQEGDAGATADTPPAEGADKPAKDTPKKEEPAKEPPKKDEPAKEEPKKDKKPDMPKLPKVPRP